MIDRFLPSGATRRHAMKALCRARSWLVACLATSVALSACAAEPPPTDDELGVFSFALTGVIPGVKAMDVKVYAGPVTSLSKLHKFELACIPYVTGANKSNNAFTLDKLPARNDYSILVNLYADDACTDLAVRAYRGGITVPAGARDDAADSPYYIQPYRLGKFTGLALANPLAQASVQKLSCTTDSDCRGEGGHPAATCQDNKCALTSLFPLNGGSPRAFPTTVGLDNGQVAISGGFSVLQPDGAWAATKQRVELFEPQLGRFVDTALSVDNFGVEARVGMAGALPWSGATFVQVGGTSQLKLTASGKTLETGLLDAPCASPTGCPVSKAVWLVDVAKQSSSGTLLAGPIALPITARVATPGGPRVLVAGGTELPVQGANVIRRGEALLCEVSAGSSSCADSKSKMAAGRANAATACVATSADGCKKLLIVGGRKSAGAPLAEVYNATNDSFEEVKIVGTPPTLVHGGTLTRAGTRFYLTGAYSKALFFEDRSTKDPAPLPPMVLEADDSKSPLELTFAKVDMNGLGMADSGQMAFSAAVGYDDGSAVVAGGLGFSNVIGTDALVIGADGKVSAPVALKAPRYGASIAKISAEGPLKGCAVLAGGITADNGNAAPVNHVEVFCPAN